MIFHAGQARPQAEQHDEEAETLLFRRRRQALLSEQSIDSFIQDAFPKDEEEAFTVVRPDLGVSAILSKLSKRNILHRPITSPAAPSLRAEAYRRVVLPQGARVLVEPPRPAPVKGDRKVPDRSGAVPTAKTPSRISSWKRWLGFVVSICIFMASLTAVYIFGIDEMPWELPRFEVALPSGDEPPVALTAPRTEEPRTVETPVVTMPAPRTMPAPPPSAKPSADPPVKPPPAAKSKSEKAKKPAPTANAAEVENKALKDEREKDKSLKKEEALADAATRLADKQLARSLKR